MSFSCGAATRAEKAGHALRCCSPDCATEVFPRLDPAIIEERILRGRSILVATSVSADSVDRATGTPQPWTVLSTWPSFPPLVQEMLALAVGGKTEGRNVLVGEEFGAVVRGPAAGSPLTVVGPDGKGHHGPRSYTLLTGFEDTEMPDAEHKAQLLSGTQYGELR